MAKKTQAQVEGKEIDLRDKLLLRRSDLAQLFNVSVSAIDRWTKVGILPKPIALGGRFTAWHKTVIDKWLDDTFNTVESNAQ